MVVTSPATVTRCGSRSGRQAPPSPAGLNYHRSHLGTPRLTATFAGSQASVSGAYGRFHFWLALPVQSQICSCTPRVVAQFVSSRHLPDCGLYNDPLACGTNTCAPVLLQS